MPQSHAAVINSNVLFINGTISLISVYPSLQALADIQRMRNGR
jgi:hypothetical protein